MIKGFKGVFRVRVTFPFYFIFNNTINQGFSYNGFYFISWGTIYGSHRGRPIEFTGERKGVVMEALEL